MSAPWIVLHGGASSLRPKLVPLTMHGPIFYQGDMPWRYKGVSAFKLVELSRLGVNIDPFLFAYEGFNVLRVFAYTPRKEWGDHAWDWPGADDVAAFCQYVGARGWYVELVLLTDDDPANINAALWLMDELRAYDLPNLIFEVGNEPETHKNILTRVLQPACVRSGHQYSSGNYEVSRNHFGSYLTFHPGRDYEWPRRAHDAIEFYGGGGPDSPSDPAHLIACVGDETIRPDQATPVPGQYRNGFGIPINDALAHFGALSLLGAGGTVHTESGKLGLVPFDYEREWIGAALQGLDAFPANVAMYPYDRPEAWQPGSLRSYTRGPYAVRIRPETLDAPESGWESIDGGKGILWRRQ